MESCCWSELIGVCFVVRRCQPPRPYFLRYTTKVFLAFNMLVLIFLSYSWHCLHLCLNRQANKYTTWGDSGWHTWSFSPVAENCRACYCLTLAVLKGLINGPWGTILTLGFFILLQLLVIWHTSIWARIHWAVMLLFISWKEKKNQEQSCQIKSTFTTVRAAWPSRLAGVIKVQQKEKAWSWLGMRRGSSRSDIWLLLASPVQLWSKLNKKA